MTLPVTFSIIIGILFFLFLLSASVVLLSEKAYRGAFISLLFAFIIPIPYLLSIFVDQIGFINYPLAVISITTIFFALLLINPKREKFSSQIPVKQFDERQTMFSRRELKIDSERFNEYYNQNPDHQPLDKVWRSKPGLLNANSVFYDSLSFSAAEASFLTIEKMGAFITGTRKETPTKTNPEALTRFIKNWMVKQGMTNAGITKMKPYHYYHTKGRREKYNNKISPKYPYGIALTVEMDEHMMQAAPKGSAIMESAEKYLKSGVPAVQLAYFLRELGYNAQAHIDGNYEVVCPLVARDGGLGEIGRMGLLMTPKLGPRVRIAVVTTDAPLIIDKPSNIANSINEFCHYCKKCANICPSQSIPFDERKVQDNVLRWKINSESCFTYWQTVGTDCGRCMAVCPYAHANNWFHNSIRFGIRHSYLFRRLAVVLDDLFYGKKPAVKKMPGWIDDMN